MADETDFCGHLLWCMFSLEEMLVSLFFSEIWCGVAICMIKVEVCCMAGWCLCSILGVLGNLKLVGRISAVYNVPFIWEMQLNFDNLMLRKLLLVVFFYLFFFFAIYAWHYVFMASDCCKWNIKMFCFCTAQYLKITLNSCTLNVSGSEQIFHYAYIVWVGNLFLHPEGWTWPGL